MITLDRDTCTYCTRAQSDPGYPLFRAQCRGCAVRSLACGPAFHKSGIDGTLATEYRKALTGIFGDDWRKGHQLVKAEHERIQAARRIS